jgi:ribonuclease HII
MLVGIDEAGRGPVLGPLVIGICCIPKEKEPLLVEAGVKDSKDLTPRKRRELEAWFNEAKEEHGWFGATVSLSAETVDLALQADGLNWLEVDGFRQALETLPVQQNLRIFADACDVNAERFTERILSKLNGWPWTNSQMVSEHKADTRYPVVAMASILAKEERDRSINAMKERVGFNVGSGYPSDPNTKAALNGLVLQSGIDTDVRWGWATVERFWTANRDGEVPVRGQHRTVQQRLFQPEETRIS